MKFPAPLLLLALAPACGAPVWRADLRPIARHDGAPVAVTVSAAGVTPDLLRHSDQSADDESTLVLRVHLHNGSAVAQSEDPRRWRLNVVGADGAQVNGAAAGWTEGELPSHVPTQFPAGKADSVWIPAGGTMTLSVAFRGLGGLTLSGAARIELVLPGDRVLLVSAPAAIGPRWTPWQRPRALLFRAGTTRQGDGELIELGMQFVFTRGPLIFGMTVMDLGALVPTEQVRGYAATGLGLFVGALPRDWFGVVAGADGLVGFRGLMDGAQRQDLWLLRTYGAVRFQAGLPVSAGGGPVPLQRRVPSPLRSMVLDLGYAYSFAHGAHPNAGGPLFMLGAPFFAF
jgi:hypothetical protein